MMTVQQRIEEQFLADLSGSADITAEQVERLRQLMATGKKIKPDELVEVFMEPAREDVA